MHRRTRLASNQPICRGVLGGSDGQYRARFVSRNHPRMTEQTPLHVQSARPSPRSESFAALDVSAVDLEGGWIHVHRSWDAGVPASS